MKRVYLDQNKWIDLAACDKGIATHARFADCLALIETSVQMGLASYPLSTVHYVETSHRRDWRSRSDLALTMGRLSRLHTIAPRKVLLPPEIDRALNAAFGSPQAIRSAQVFGVGINHAFGFVVVDYRAPEDAPLDAVSRRVFEQWVRDQEEWLVLTGLPPELEKDLVDYQPMKHREVTQDMAERAETMRLRRRDGGWSGGDRGCRVAKANGYVDNLDELNEAFERAGIPAGWLMAQGAEAMSEFIDGIPLIHTHSELWRLREAAVNKPWEANDMNDMDALTRAIVYCDIVVTERQWVDLVRRGRLDAMYDTIVISDLRELPRLLI